RSIGRRSNVHFAHEVFAAIADAGNSSAVGLDITGFFDNIRHSELKKNWARVLGVDALPDDHYAVFSALTRYAHAERDTVHKMFGVDLDRDSKLRHRPRLCSIEQFRQLVRPIIKTHRDPHGIPQGSPISALASNMSMIGFDQAAHAAASSVCGMYRRYSDDIFIMCPPGMATTLELRVIDELKAVGLEIQPEKTVKAEFRLVGNTLRLVGGEPLPYLGFVFDGRRRLIRPSSVSRYWRKALKRIRASKRKAKKVAMRGANPKTFRKDIYEKHTHLGKSNFVRYAYRSAAIMGDPSIRRQVRRHWKKINNLLRDE
ncbi:MAG: hypothetical protein HY246_23155, partial [Proteobacteria bacterium]|nr:hypothetical protein [Pseudomonadota bacterium]